MLGKPVPRSLSPLFEVLMNRFLVFVFAFFLPSLPHGRILGFSQHTYPGVQLFSKQGSERADPRSNSGSIRFSVRGLSFLRAPHCD